MRSRVSPIKRRSLLVFGVGSGDTVKGFPPSFGNSDLNPFQARAQVAKVGMSLLQDIRIYPPIIAYQCCVPLKQVYPEARVVAKFFSAAFGGREEGRSEDTSRSVKGLAAPCNPAYSRSCNSPDPVALATTGLLTRPVPRGSW